MTNTTQNETFKSLLEEFDSFMIDNNFKTLKDTQIKLFPGKSDKYLYNGLSELKKGRNDLFSKRLKEAMESFKINPKEIQISDHVYFTKINQIQNKPFSKNEIDGMIGKYLMFSIYDKEMVLISSLEIFQAHEETKHTYESLLFFKANRINIGYDTDEDECIDFVNIKTNGYVTKNSTDKLICQGITEHIDATYTEMLAISGFGNSFTRNKTGLWFGISFTNHQKIFTLRSVIVKIPNKNLEREFEEKRDEIIKYHNEEELNENDLIKRITSHPGSISLYHVMARLRIKKGANYIKLEPYD